MANSYEAVQTTEQHDFIICNSSRCCRHYVILVRLSKLHRRLRAKIGPKFCMFLWARPKIKEQQPGSESGHLGRVNVLCKNAHRVTKAKIIITILPCVFGRLFGPSFAVSSSYCSPSSSLATSIHPFTGCNQFTFSGGL